MRRVLIVAHMCLCVWTCCCIVVVDFDVQVDVQVDPCDALDGSVPDDAVECDASETCQGVGMFCICNRCLEGL